MTHVVEHFPSVNVVVDSDGDVRPPEDFQDADHAFIEIPDRPVIEPIVEVEPATPASTPIDVSEQNFYDNQLEKEADKLGSYPLARAALERRGIADPSIRTQASINRDGAEAIRQIARDEALAKIEAIFDPEEREKARTLFLAKERKRNEDRTKPYGPVRS